MRAANGAGRAGSALVVLGAGALIASAPAWAAPEQSADAGEPGRAAQSADTNAGRDGATRSRAESRAQHSSARRADSKAVVAVAIPSVAEAIDIPTGRTPNDRRVAGARSAPAARAAAQTSAIARATARADAAANPIAELFFNATPTLNPTRTGQDSQSVVTGDLNIDDPDSAAVTYTVTEQPERGSVVVDADGRYTYTPDDAYARIGTTDAFTVTVSDAPSGFHIHGLEGLLNLLSFGLIGAAGHATTTRVTVVVDPRNTAPVAAVAVGGPDPVTGVVTGAVLGSDDDGDPLTYTGPSATDKGAVNVAADGTFTYTPTAEARHAAASAMATVVDKTDSFTVTVADGFGGTVDVVVAVEVSPLNEAPVGGVSVGTPDPATGRVTGRVTATDADGDALTYTGPTSTAKGAVTVALDGTFTYLPTPTARHRAAALNATVADKTDTFTVTVSDGSGGSTAVLVTVAISPTNNAPVSGGAVVGSPNATTGVVTGSVVAVDADGDPLTYSAATPAKGTATVAANGSFTYTPSTSARQSAAAPGATDADTSDAFTVTVTDGHGGSVAIPVSVTVAPAVAPPVQNVVSFGFVYGAGSQYWTPEARSALESTAASLASYFVVGTPVTITVNVSGINSPSSGTLAYASVSFTGGGSGFYRTVVQQEIITGVDPNGGTADASITYNWSYPWALGNSVSGSEYDFKAVAIHELLHTVGFLTGTGGNPASADRNWTTYDSFLATSNGTRVIGNDYRIVSGLVGNFTGAGGGLYFAGPNAVAAYGGPVPLYTPGSWEEGSSVSHVDELPGYVMEPFSGYGLGVRVLTPVEVAILRDLGFTMRDQPLVYAILLIGLGLRRRRR